MKDREKQIEELAKDIGYELGISYEEEKLPFSLHTRDYLAKALIEKGYQKVDKDSVVISKEEYERITKELVTEQRAKKIAQEYFGIVRKETAREIIEMFNDKNYITEKDLIKAIAKRYGVKIKNG
jgi:hypothetical protein